MIGLLTAQKEGSSQRVITGGSSAVLWLWTGRPNAADARPYAAHSPNPCASLPFRVPESKFDFEYETLLKTIRPLVGISMFHTTLEVGS
jgi:hypothetical protein